MHASRPRSAYHPTDLTIALAELQVDVILCLTPTLTAALDLFLLVVLMVRLGQVGEQWPGHLDYHLGLTTR